MRHFLQKYGNKNRSLGIDLVERRKKPYLCGMKNIARISVVLFAAFAIVWPSVAVAQLLGIFSPRDAAFAPDTIGGSQTFTTTFLGTGGGKYGRQYGLHLF
ncbi:MAG: hypothetical protein ACHQNE_01430 [Candidatus Kapaibacterium sp.]